MENPEGLESIEACRARIDAIDLALVRLLNERARVSIRVGQLKADDEAPVFIPGREEDVLTNVVAANPGPLDEGTLRAIWREILSSSRAFQRKLRIAYLGPVATYSYDAAVRRFGRTADLVPCETIPDVFAMTSRRQVDYGVVPIENSNAGGVPFTLDTFVDSDVRVCAEIALPIGAHLLSHGTLATIEKVYSHPIGIGQCRRWLTANLPRAEIVELNSTARAVELAREPTVAAIGSESAAELYGVPVLVRDIADQAHNVTRFLVIGDHVATPTGRDKTAIIFSVRDRAGALYDALRLFAEASLNLTRIESRPSKRQPWEYLFFVDVEGHQSDPALAGVLDRLRETAQSVKVLGSWPAEPAPAAR